MSLKWYRRAYWVVTGLMAVWMTLAAVPDLLRDPQALAIFSHLGYPAYLLPFLGAAKSLGVIVVLVPGFPRLREWAYAGLAIDVVGALYSHLSVGDGPAMWWPAVLAIALIGGSYLLARARQHAALELGRAIGAGSDSWSRVA